VTKAAVALMLTGGICGSLTSAYAYQASGRGADEVSVPVNKAVDLDLANADLGLVVDAIQRQTGANIVIQAGQKPFGKVNVHLNNMPLDRALRNVALSAGATLIKDSDGTFILRQGGQGNQFAQDDDRTPAVTRQALSPSDLHWYKIVLQHAVPHDVLYLMHWDAGVRSISPFSSSSLPQNNFDNHPGIVLMSGDPVAPSVPGGNGSRGPAQANRYDTSDGSSQAQQFPGGGGGIGGIGGGNQQLPEGVDEMLALQADNSLLLHATPEAFQRIREIIKDIDVAPRQVQIRVEFVRADVNDVDQFGINYEFVPYPGVNFSSNMGLGGASYGLNFATGNLVAQMLATLTHGRAKILNAPIITTTNNVQGQILVDNQIPVTTTTTVVPNGGNTVTNSQITFQDIPTQLSVTPRINSDDSITLPLSLNISTPLGAVGNSGAQQTNSQRLQTVRTVRNGETMVLGGFINDNEQSSRTSIPILGDLPLIGGLFRNRSRTVNNSELLIFVTPTIIGEDLGSSLVGTGASGGSVTP